MYEYESLAGESITQTADALVSLAWCRRENVTATFNDVSLVATPSTTPEEILVFYQAESDRRAAAYRASPAYQDQERERIDAQERQTYMLQGALLLSPPDFTRRDDAAWEQAVAANREPYGAAILRYAALWARLMEGKMQHGTTLTQCAMTASRIADTEGITGFMYGAAVSVLAACWIHGEALRQWHNLETQLGDEGTRANQEGSVLNPALLQLG